MNLRGAVTLYYKSHLVSRARQFYFAVVSLAVRTWKCKTISWKLPGAPVQKIVARRKESDIAAVSNQRTIDYEERLFSITRCVSTRDSGCSEAIINRLNRVGSKRHNKLKRNTSPRVDRERGRPSVKART